MRIWSDTPADRFTTVNEFRKTIHRVAGHNPDTLVVTNWVRLTGDEEPTQENT